MKEQDLKYLYLERFLWGYDVQQLMPRPKLLHYICTSGEPYIYDVYTEREWGWGLEMCHFRINIMCYFCRWSGGGGVKKLVTFIDVINVRPLGKRKFINICVILNFCFEINIQY